MTKPAPAARRLRRLAVGAGVVLALVAPLTTGSALGALQARIDNTTNSAASGTLLYTHSYGSTCTSVPASITDAIQTVACPNALYPASSVGSRTDSITANGTVPAARITESASIASCGIVRLANSNLAANPLLPRYGTSFATTGPFGAASAITLDGATVGGYASAAATETEFGGVSLSSGSYGVGIWFRTTSSVGGPLFSLGSSSARDTTESFDRTLYLTATGQVVFNYRTSGTATTASTATYRDGNWHFVYARATVASLALGMTVTVSVDGTQVATTSGILSGLDSLSGYWHLGWSPATKGVPVQYFAGSLSNFMVFNGGTAPTSPTSKPTTQAAVDTFAAAATDYWPLADAGTTTLASGFTLPVIGTTAPCSYVDITWGFTTPTSCAIAPTSTTSACTVSTTKLSTAADGSTRTVATVAAAGTQASTITLAQDSTYTGTAATFLPGLITHAPVSLKFKVTTATQWFTTFSWTTAASGFLL